MLEILGWGAGALFIFIVVAFVAGSVQAEKENEIREQFKSIANFDATYFHIATSGPSISVDPTSRKFAIIKPGIGHKVYTYDDLLAVEARRNGGSVQRTNRGSQIGGAAVGGLLFGGVGAVIGGLSGSKRTEGMVSELSLRLVVNNQHSPNVDVNFYKGGSLPESDPNIQQASNRLDDWHARILLIMKS